MTQWHADLGGPGLGAGTELTVQSHHHVVRVMTADTIMIQTPDGQRFSALVLDRTGPRIQLTLTDGRRSSLELLVDEAFRPQEAGAVFSSQTWRSH